MFSKEKMNTVHSWNNKDGEGRIINNVLLTSQFSTIKATNTITDTAF